MMLAESTIIAEEPSAAPRPAEDAAIAISVRDVGKMYRIYDRPQDRLKQMLWRGHRTFGHEFWALRNIAFDVRQGESVGIIGRNGSGKSTLLQIIAGTLTPTEGEASVAGRVNALLELGSGFNPEFTGRENVFMNGAILGMSNEEMAERFDEIAAFADIGEFIEQPVKLYSSGMALRLAFAVQAIVPKEVLIVDEALAVGDEAFQRKCMRTLEQFRENGGTVLLVSHSAQTIVRQCSRCLFLHRGELLLDGPSKPVTDIYQRFILGSAQQQQQTLDMLRNRAIGAEEAIARISASQASDSQNGPADLPVANRAILDPNVPATAELTYGGGQAEIFDCGMYNLDGQPVNVLVTGQTYTWRYRVRFLENAWNLNFGMMLRTVDGIAVAAINSAAEGHRYERYEQGSIVEVRFELRMNIATGIYYTEAGVVGETATGTGEGGFLQRRLDISAIRIIPPDSREINGFAYLDPQIEVRSV
ncbi:MAG TPA: ABC transporter ATP-binding protein [Roseiflexaceae bacterium]|nr:ABC transporter ATP-binding protein [Roseiflexaceae bacterium]